MGQIVFEVPPDLPADRRGGLDRAFFAGGYDAMPVPTRRAERANGFALTRAEADSGYLCVPWANAAGADRVVCSSTLRQTTQPYPVLVELARGAVNRVRAFVSVLTTAGLPFPPEFATDLAAATRQFGRLVLGSEPSTEAAVRLIDDAGALADQAAAVLTSYRLTARTQAHGSLPTRFGGRLSRPLPPDQTELFLDTFNAVQIVPVWRAIEPTESAFNWSELDPLVEWATAAELDVSFGPLIDLGGPFPDWLTAWSDDLPNLAAFFADFIATVVSRYRDRVRTWHVFAGFNHADALGLGEDDRLRLAARVLEATTELDPKADRVLSLGQPWGDYLKSDAYTYSPYVFADTLLRAGLSVSAVQLELTAAAGRGGMRRDALDTIHLLEQFDTFGLPLEIEVGPANPDVIPTILGAPNVRAVYCDAWHPADAAARQPDLNWVGADGRPTATAEALLQHRRRWLT